MKSFSTVRLIIILGVLVGIYMVVKMIGNNSRSKTFREALVTIDTSKVSKVNIYSPEDTVQLVKETGKWLLDLGNKLISAKESSIKNFFTTLEGAKPSSIASRKEEKWKDYQVDSAGIRVEIYEGSDKTLDMIIGRFNVQGRNSFSTYVRLAEEKEVYAADNFMGISVPKNETGFRENILFRLDSKDSLTQITFDYPDSAFTLNKVDNSWLIDGQPADSAGVAKYLSSLSYVSSIEFDDDETDFSIPTISVAYIGKNQTIKIGAVQKADDWVIHTDENKDGYFKDQQLFEKVFVGKTSFSLQ